MPRLTPNTLHPTPYTLHLTPYTLHLTPYTLHLTPYTLHPTPYTLHPMTLSPKYKVRNVAGDDIVLIQGRNPGDLTTVIAINETSLYLWNQLKGRDFELSDVCNLLTDRYDVDDQTALDDAKAWISTLSEHDILLP